MFEAYKKPNLDHKFTKAPETRMEFRFPTSENDRDLERFLDTRPTLLEARVYQLSLLFESTNIKTEKGVPIIKVEDPILLKMDIFLSMPIGMVEELHGALMDYYPDWKLTD